MSDDSDYSGPESDEESLQQKQSKPKAQTRFKRIQRMPSSSESDSSDDEESADENDESLRSTATRGSNNNSLEVPEESKVNENDDNADDSLELPPTDEDDDSLPAELDRTRTNHLSSDEAETDDEDQRRRTRYQAESDEEDKPASREDAMTMRKSIRKSINPLESVAHTGTSEYLDSDSDDEEIVVSESENEEDRVDENANHGESHKSNKNVANGVTKHKDSINFDDSIAAKFSSTMIAQKNAKEEEIVDLSDESDDGIIESKSLVSKTAYSAEVAKKEKMEQELANMMRILDHAKNLPDGGQKLHSKVADMRKQLQQQTQHIGQLQVDESLSVKNEIAKSFEKSLEVVEVAQNVPVIPVIELNDNDYLKAVDVQPKYTGKVGMKNFETKKALTVETLQEFADSLQARPTEDQLDEPPKYLKVTLMRHQLHALKFMRWRETQKVKGGILADDMGLGKTLTTISLIMKQLQYDEEKDEESEEQEDSDDEDTEKSGWLARGRRERLVRGGTLVIAPASLLKQWEMEIDQKVKRGALDVTLFHGPKRIYKAKELAKYDVVITSYQTIASEYKNEGIVYKIKFRRIVLDEGHIIRNHKTQQTKAVCELKAERRWLLSGTPVQNKEFDLYAVIKFLRCSPFNDLAYWKNFVESKSKTTSSPRVQALLKSILLRRTKEQLIESKDINSLPEKSLDLVKFSLTAKERFVYNRLMSYSKTIFAQYMQQNQQKNNDFCYDKDRLAHTYKAFARKFKSDREIQNHEILVLLLRLRQSCCHPSLIKAMVDRADLQGEGDANSSDNHHDQSDIIRELEKMNLNDEDAGDHQWSLENEVFDEDEPSSKMRKMLELLKEAIKDGSKAIVVSQWTAHLDIIKAMLIKERINSLEFNGRIAVKDRNDVVCQFNDPKSRFSVLLLSLCSGGVGLNLVGANHMFIMDLHWNPQLEQQGQDRIYRFGQKKNVKIHKFICSDTIEERILDVQTSKLEVANSALTGAKTTNRNNKLTLADLKQLFDM